MKTQLNIRPKIKIFGERNTGTRYLHELICENLEVNILIGIVPEKLRRLHKGREWAKDMFFKLTFPYNLGWKHALVNPSRLQHMKLSKKLFFVTITKNPYSWLLSLYKRPYHSTSHFSCFEEFLTTPWETVGRENALHGFANPIDMWNKKNAAYCELKNVGTTINLKYENILADPVDVLEKLSQNFSIKKKNNHFKNIEESTKERLKNFLYYQDYYLHERWKDQLTKPAVATINKYLDENIMQQFGYQKIVL